MLRTGAIVALLVAAVVAPARAGLPQEPALPPYPWSERAASAEEYASKRSGRVDWAVVAPDGRVRGSGIHARHRSASVVKAMLLVAYLNHGDVPRRGLRGADKALLRPMILRSDNRSATSVRDIVGNGSLERLARRVRMRDFAVSAASWGSTQTSAYDQARLFWRIDAYVPRRHRAYARSLLAGIVDRHRWGIPPARPAGWEILFKGGWHQPHRVNQVALLRRGRARIAIAVLTDGNPSFGHGKQTITGLARRLLMRLNDFEFQS